MKHHDNKEPLEWLEKAWHDLDAAKKLLQEDGFPDTITFHCHQVAEKSLKGALLWLGVDYPFTHDLTLLIQHCIQKDVDFQDLQDYAIQLSPLYEEQRYPYSEAEIFTQKELQQFITSADKIYARVKSKLQN